MKRNVCDYLDHVGKVHLSRIPKGVGAAGEFTVISELRSGVRGLSAVISICDRMPATEATQSQRSSARYYGFSERALHSLIVWHGKIPSAASLYRKWRTRLPVFERRTPTKLDAINWPNFAKQALSL